MIFDKGRSEGVEEDCQECHDGDDTQNDYWELSDIIDLGYRLKVVEPSREIE